MNSLFGPDWKGTPIAESLPHVETPVGWECLHCGEPIAPGDSGIMQLYLSLEDCRPVATHRECHLRCVFGCVAHQQKASHQGCDRTCEDDPALSKRDAARAAVAHWEHRNGVKA